MWEVLSCVGLSFHNKTGKIDQNIVFDCPEESQMKDIQSFPISLCFSCLISVCLIVSALLYKKNICKCNYRGQFGCWKYWEVGCLCGAWWEWTSAVTGMPHGLAKPMRSGLPFHTSATGFELFSSSMVRGTKLWIVDLSLAPKITASVHTFLGFWSVLFETSTGCLKQS